MFKDITGDIFGSIKDHFIIALVFVILSAVVLVDQAGNRTQGIFPIMGKILQLQAADNIPEDNKEIEKEIVHHPAPEIVRNGQSDITLGNTEKQHEFKIDYYKYNNIETTFGILQEECSNILQEFFKNLRKR